MKYGGHQLCNVSCQRNARHNGLFQQHVSIFVKRVFPYGIPNPIFLVIAMLPTTATTTNQHVHNIVVP
eukprot:5995248-Pyramimonas_sp.AAC.1